MCLGAIGALLALSSCAVDLPHGRQEAEAGPSSHDSETSFDASNDSSFDQKDQDNPQQTSCPDCGMQFAGKKWLRMHRRWCEAHQSQMAKPDNEPEAKEGKEEKRSHSGKVKKRMWTEEEDRVVIDHVMKLGKAAKWTKAAALLPGRNGKNVRERWYNHLDPSINKKPWTDDEDRIILQAQMKFGNQWRYISTLLPGRTDNAIKNHRNSTIRRRIMQSGIESYGFIEGVTDASPKKLAALDSIGPG